jgi:hypothetical protein
MNLYFIMNSTLLSLLVLIVASPHLVVCLPKNRAPLSGGEGNSIWQDIKSKKG